MSQNSRDESLALSATIDDDTVRQYLIRNPDFFEKHADLFRILTPPQTGHDGNVLDLQQFMVRRLQAEIAHAQNLQQAIVETGRSNLAVQNQIHQAVASLVAARSLEALLSMVMNKLPDIFDLDVASLCIETGPEGMPQRLRDAGALRIAPGAIDKLLGPGREVRLLRDKGASQIFGPMAGRVESQALARLHPQEAMPQALVAFGSRDPERFSPDQATDFVQFFARVLESQLDIWASQNIR